MHLKDVLNDFLPVNTSQYFRKHYQKFEEGVQHLTPEELSVEIADRSDLKLMTGVVIKTVIGIGVMWGLGKLVPQESEGAVLAYLTSLGPLGYATMRLGACESIIRKTERDILEEVQRNTGQTPI